MHGETAREVSRVVDSVMSEPLKEGDLGVKLLKVKFSSNNILASRASSSRIG